MTGTIFDIKEFALHDGPGARTTVFLKGCPLRCGWCHNPEGLKREKQLMVKTARCKGCGRCLTPCNHFECQPYKRCVHACPDGLVEICGKDFEAEELAKELMKNADFFKKNNGGVTISGGEPLLQWEFTEELLDKLDCHTAIETSGYAQSDVFKRIINKVDYVLMDIKLADRDEHKKYTGVYNDIILENFEYLRKSGKEYIVRTPMIPGITDTENNLKAIEKIIGSSKWEKLKYNALAGVKYPMLGMEYTAMKGDLQ